MLCCSAFSFVAPKVSLFSVQYQSLWIFIVHGTLVRETKHCMTIIYHEISATVYPIGAFTMSKNISFNTCIKIWRGYLLIFMKWKRRECLTFSVTLCLSPLSLFSSFSHSFPIVMLRVPYLSHLWLILVHWPQVVWADSELVLRKPEFVCCIGQTHLSKRNKTCKLKKNMGTHYPEIMTQPWYIHS